MHRLRLRGGVYLEERVLLVLLLSERASSSSSEETAIVKDGLGGVHTRGIVRCMEQPRRAYDRLRDCSLVLVFRLSGRRFCNDTERLLDRGGDFMVCDYCL